MKKTPVQNLYLLDGSARIYGRKKIMIHNLKGRRIFYIFAAVLCVALLAGAMLAVNVMAADGPGGQGPGSGGQGSSGYSQHIDVRLFLLQILLKVLLIQTSLFRRSLMLYMRKVTLQQMVQELELRLSQSLFRVLRLKKTLLL